LEFGVGVLINKQFLLTMVFGAAATSSGPSLSSDEVAIAEALAQQVPADLEVGGKVTSAELARMVVERALQTWQGQLLYDMTHLLRVGNFEEAWSLFQRFPLFFMCIALFTLALGYFIFALIRGSSDEDSNTPQQSHAATNSISKPEPPVLRDFTPEQLREHDGVHSTTIYIALVGDVYDVSGSSEFYGKDGPYHCFAGRDASRAMAKLSFEEADLASGRDLSDLGPFERSTLEDWVDKFKYYKAYPVVGKLTYPSPGSRVFTPKQLDEFKGTGPVPEGRVHSPIYVGVRGVVYDVSYGGYEMYSEGSSYHVFAGRDASRGLAKMSLSPEDCASSDLSDLTPAQLKTLDEWVNKFAVVRKYPVVGSISSTSVSL
jgi:membrane-associated progesterone receptor component